MKCRRVIHVLLATGRYILALWYLTQEETDSEAATPATTISISPPEETSQNEDLPSPCVRDECERDADGEPKSPTKERVGNKLRKFRSKTISLFSRDGTGTLPR